jgi:hypothetical protein
MRAPLLLPLLLFPRAAAADALGDRIDAAIAARPELARTRVGVCVIDVQTGQTLVARAADDAFNVASVVKLITSGAALAVLGPEFRFKTTLMADTWDGRETITGDLFLRGGGDPTLTTESLWKLAGALRTAGTGPRLADGRCRHPRRVWSLRIAARDLPLEAWRGYEWRDSWARRLDAEASGDFNRRVGSRRRSRAPTSSGCMSRRADGRPQKSPRKRALQLRKEQ